MRVGARAWSGMHRYKAASPGGGQCRLQEVLKAPWIRGHEERCTSYEVYRASDRRSNVRADHPNVEGDRTGISLSSVSPF
jgi:hypothetical protein